MRGPLAHLLARVIPFLMVVGAIGWSPAPAQAGEFYTSPVCANSTDVLNFFAEANFFGLSNCESLCKKAHGKCKEFLGKSKACENATVAMQQFFEKETECDPIEDPDLRTTCRESVREQARNRKQMIKTEDGLGKDACLEIRDGCIAGCNPM